jgi:hypothetical protein
MIRYVPGENTYLNLFRPVTRNETSLATVTGHEVSYAVAQHGNERMSQALLTQLGGTALSVALFQNPSQTSDLFMAAYGIGTQVGVLPPYSRLQESEVEGDTSVWGSPGVERRKPNFSRYSSAVMQRATNTFSGKSL